MRPIIGKTDVPSSPNASIWISSIWNDTFACTYAHFEVFVSMDISSWCKATGFLQFYFCWTIFFISSKNLPQRLAILTHKKEVVPTFSIFDYPPFESVPFSFGNKTRKMTDTGYAAFCGRAFFHSVFCRFWTLCEVPHISAVNKLVQSIKLHRIQFLNCASLTSSAYAKTSQIRTSNRLTFFIYLSEFCAMSEYENPR